VGASYNFLAKILMANFLSRADLQGISFTFASTMNEKMIRVNGIYCLEGDTDITRYVRQTGTLKWDKPFDFISKFLGDGSDKVMIDIGAYIGDSAKWFLDTGWTCHVFEPQKDAFKCLELNLAGTRSFFYNEALGSGQSISLAEHDTGNLGGRSLDLGGSLKAKKIDDFDIKANFLKIDAEGFEPYILEGAKNLLDQRPIVAIEINIPGLNKYGFWPHDILKYFENYDAIETYNWQGYQYDLLLIPKEKTAAYIDVYEFTYKEKAPHILDFSKTVYVVLGRFGDIYMVAKNLKQPSILCCSTRFSTGSRRRWTRGSRWWWTGTASWRFRA
jgi:FkbM family methyltransferase